MKRLHWLALLCAVGAVIPIAFMGWRGNVGFRDFTDIWLAGRAVTVGVNPYDVSVFNQFGAAMLGAHPYNWTYPPPMLFVALLASLPAYSTAFFIWNLLTAALFYWSLAPFLERNLRLLALSTPAAILNVIYGQTGFLVGALWFLAFRYSPTAALLIIKPHIGFLAGLPMLKDWRRTAIGAALGTGLIVASGAVFGGWKEFFQHASQVQAHGLWHWDQIVWVVMATAPGVGYGISGWLAFAAAAAWFLSRNFNVWTAATATFLISPYGYHYDMTAMCAGLLLLLYERGSEMPVWKASIIIAAFLSPAWVRLAGTWFVPPVLLIALAIQTEWQREIGPSARPINEAMPVRTARGGDM